MSDPSSKYYSRSEHIHASHYFRMTFVINIYSTSLYESRVNTLEIDINSLENKY